MKLHIFWKLALFGNCYLWPQKDKRNENSVDKYESDIKNLYLEKLLYW